MAQDAARECKYCDGGDIEFRGEPVEVLGALAQELFSRLEKL
jgi:hypothetical protein